MSTSESNNGANKAEKVKKDENSESREQHKKDESDEDIPGDFFDDFLKEDFMAGLDIVDDDEWDEDKIKLTDEVLVTKKDTDVELTKKDPPVNSSQVDTENKKNEREGQVDAEVTKKDHPRHSSEVDSTKKKRKDRESKAPVNSSQVDSTKRKKKHQSQVEEKLRSKEKKKREEQDSHKHKRKEGRQIDADEFDIRRDPEKTKRDIARDKVRCEKDKEMKIISEKLSLVETGLVPPGTEMEIDIEEIKKQKEQIENKSPRDLRERIRNLKERNKSPGQRDRSPRRKEETGSSPFRNRELVLSPLRRRTELEPNSPTVTKRTSSPRKRSRSPRRIPRTVRGVISPKRSPFRRMSPRRSPPRVLSPRRRSLERISARRRSRSRSPFYRGRRDKYSPNRRRNRSDSRESDREKWLKRRHHSRSPRRKRDDKKSFLQEIAEKLNEIRQPVNIMTPLQPMQPMLQPMQSALRYVQPQPLPVPAPTPVPPPNSAPLFLEPLPPQQQYDPYDQSFFIGNPQIAMPNDFSRQPQHSPQILLNNVSPQSLNPPGNLPPHAMQMSNASTQVQHISNQRRVPKTQEDVSKLFQDNQITLSEFLAITAKPEVLSTSPVHLQEKIRVITRCHEAMNILSSSEKKYSGRLVVHRTDKYKTRLGNQSSPLKSTPAVQFPFTNPLGPGEEQKRSFTQFINDLLQKLGLLKETVVDVDDDPSEANINTKGKTNVCPPPPPLIKPLKHSISDTNHIKIKFQEKRLSKMIQTDVFKCESCEKRKKILYRSTALQTNDAPVTFSVSTQVTEEDFQPKIPKTQSLAALTPAQLLAKSRESLNAASRGNRLDMDSYDMHISGYNNRSNYGLPRSSLLPFPNPSLSIYDSLNSQMLGGGGGGRGRESFVPRTKDPNVRFSYNNYY